jgi:hypothetical protein
VVADPSHNIGDNLNNVRHETVELPEQKGVGIRERINEPETKSNNKNVRLIKRYKLI